MLGSGGVHRWLVPFWQLGGEFNNADGTKITIFNDKGVQALEWCLKLLKILRAQVVRGLFGRQDFACSHLVAQSVGR